MTDTLSKCLDCGHKERTGADGVDCIQCGGMMIKLEE